MEKTVETHLSRIQRHLATGRNILRSPRTDELMAYDIPDVVLDRNFTQTPTLRDTEKFYLATDEQRCLPHCTRGHPRLGHSHN